MLPRLLLLPAELLGGERRARWQRLLNELPAIPLREPDGVRMLAPAGRYQDRRTNLETPELYAVWPFRLFGLGKPHLEWARAAFARRPDRHQDGWPQDGQFAALLGLVDEARSQPAGQGEQHATPRTASRSCGARTTTGCPTSDHGGNLLETAQLMLLQCVGDVIRVLPCWPQDWDVSFQLHAPHDTVVEVDYHEGALARLDVTPAARRRDVVVGPDAHAPPR